jgi:hypothetical protein
MEKPWVEACESRIILDMRKPETTKNTSTPKNPPGASGGNAWNKTTDKTATARKPWTSGLNFTAVYLDVAVLAHARNDTGHAQANLRALPSVARHQL